MEQNTQAPLFELQVDHQSSSYLADTARWAKFIAIVGFVLCGLILLVAIFAGSMLASFSRFGGGGVDGVAAAGLGGFVTVVYILIGLLYFFPCLYLFNFATKMQVALRNNDQEQLGQSFRNLKACYRFIGVLLIIYLGFIALALIFGVIGAAFH
ncbi:MAG: DUF5362 family protein [Bacteroidota bacterium]|nr:DUF5362 family protein [Bacteroidota bacterium]MDP4218604.1 DUF5362 family protein [Bacteroidota bacterium]MDP4246381.1 DUF5362 family protein [Bacteroidota bacterium]MDP4254345.1 DUF5362 family protein [Bacteroidota bacterium]MDP4259472.1 DUF5362 family protein [Bacteroidota bacterium]